MRVAYVHILPLEYYPPATNSLEIMSQRPEWTVRAWSSPNHRGLPTWTHPRVAVTRHVYTQNKLSAVQRLLGYLLWHLRTAGELAAFKPDVIISIEPHSAIAIWMYFNVFRCAARLFIHHHELYVPEDFEAAGMRLVRIAARLEKNDLFSRAEWISETNRDRLNLLAVNAGIDPDKGRVLPNYPQLEWIQRAATRTPSHSDRVRIIYLGSASLEHSFIEEFAHWIAVHPDVLSLDVIGNNIAEDAWAALEKIGASNISLNSHGISYHRLPETLGSYDIGVILYRGLTKNFVYNVPNKAIEYLAAGLDVWYPVQMLSMKTFAEESPHLPLVRLDFANLPAAAPQRIGSADSNIILSFSAEAALEPMIEQIESGHK
ncbi:MAG TPA: hypothetical protein VJL35_13525 [Gemmatimonadaceae bacterium]|nr:hypothetical protein [Gemmatimonadaceae bacterium]